MLLISNARARHISMDSQTCSISLFLRVIYPKTGTHFSVTRTKFETYCFYENASRYRLKFRNFIKISMVGILLSIGCFSVSAFARDLASDPNAVLPVDALIITTSAGDFHFTIEVADDESERSQGLMFRKSMLPTHGMLFDFGVSRSVFMWMENTPLSLDMVFVREDGSVARIERKTTPYSRKVISSGENVTYVLELNAGIARQIGLKRGDKLSFSSIEQ